MTSLKSKTKSHIRFIDLFSGIGGFHYALYQQGATCVFASEIDPNCREVYRNNFKLLSPNLFKNYPTDSLNKFAGDITTIDPNTVPDHEVLCAGFPCQPFSISGHKKGFHDTRGTLFFNVMEIVKAKNPKVVLLENVKHLVHHDNGNTLNVILNELKTRGYKVSWKVLNAKDFGLAQNRERIIIVANKNNKFDFSKIEFKPQSAIKDILDNNGNFEYLESTDYTILSKEIWKKQRSGLIFCGYRNKALRIAGTRPNTSHLSRVHKQPNRIYHIDGTHPTLPAQETSGRFWIYDNKKVRKLTIDEAYRLQGFPKNFIKSNKLTAAYSQIGNSVAIPMIEAIYSQIKVQLLDSSIKKDNYQVFTDLSHQTEFSF